MLAMRDLPREVWNQECRVADEADSVIERLGGRERLVATFMGHNPQTGTKASLNESIEGPSSCTDAIRRNVGRSPQCVKEGEGGRKGEDVSSNIHQASGRRTLEAVLGYSITNIVDGELGNLEFIAMGIDQLPKLRIRIDEFARQFRVDQTARLFVVDQASSWFLAVRLTV